MKARLLILFLALASSAGAQGIEGVRRGLEPQIVVTETPDVQSVTTMLDAAPRPERMSVYAVRLFSDNSQSAGANARAAAARFGGMYGEWEPRVDYQIPYFRVTVGRFVDRTDAVALCGKVLGSFPKAFVVEEKISIE